MYMRVWRISAKNIAPSSVEKLKIHTLAPEASPRPSQAGARGPRRHSLRLFVSQRYAGTSGVSLWGFQGVLSLHTSQFKEILLTTVILPNNSLLSHVRITTISSLHSHRGFRKAENSIVNM